MRTFFRCGKLSFQPRLAEGEAISSRCEILLNFLSREVEKVWGYSNIITVIWWCIRGKRGRTGNAWNRLHSSITARTGWRLPTVHVIHEPTFLQEWTNEWPKDQFFQVNVSCQLPRQWCGRQKPKQARRPCSCWQLYELTQMKLKSRPVRVGAHPDWLV